MLELFCLEIFEVALWRIILSRSENAISGVFSVVMEPRVRPTPHFRYNDVFSLFNLLFLEILELVVYTPSSDVPTPEMNDLECALKSLKS